MDRRAESRKIVRLERRKTFPNYSPDIDNLNFMGFYSVNTNVEFVDNLSQLRYLKRPPRQIVNFDLKITAGRNIRRKFINNEMKLDSLLKWILAHQKECAGSPAGEIVCYRGLFKKVMATPYEKREGWMVCATRFQGKIYIFKYDTPQQVWAEKNRSARERNLSDWGYVFEQYMVSDHPKNSPDMSKPTDQNEEFSCVFRTRLGQHNLLFAAEMDGLKIDEKLVNLEEPISDAGKLKDLLEKGHAKFVELKTSADSSFNQFEWSKICSICRININGDEKILIKNLQQNSSLYENDPDFLFKSLQWWIQCYLGSIKELICGYRGDDGILRSVKTFSVESLPQLGQGHWKPDVCLDYCNRFLDLMTEHVSNGPDEVLWSFVWNPGSPDYIQIEQLDKDSEYCFLHGWFTDELKKNAN